MEIIENPDINEYILRYSYLGILIWFLVIEQLTPVPEEIYLIGLGYILMHAGLNPFLGGMAALTGLGITDNILFYLAYKGNRFTQKLLQKIKPQWREKVQTRLKEHPGRTVVIAALIPKGRFFSPILAATSGIRWRTFFIYNSLASTGYVAFYMIAGMLFHKQLSVLGKEAWLMRHIVFLSVMVMLAIGVIWISKRNFFNKKS